MSPTLQRLALVDRVRAEMHDLFAATQRLDIRHFEDSPASEVAEQLLPRVKNLVDEALSIATQLLGHYDTAEAPPSFELEAPTNFELALDTALAQTTERNKVADLAFMANVELKQRRARLVTLLPTSPSWDMVCECGSALRRIQKTLGALEVALCEAEQLPRVLGYDSELEISRQTRRQYRKLWTFTRKTAEVRPDGVRHALRGGGTLIAMLVGRDVYCRLRERDRFQLRQLQRRILAWLEQEDSDPRAGIRLWEDFAGFVQMLRQVSLRQELREHDIGCLKVVARSLGQNSGQPVTSALAVLRCVEGLDDELDAFLERTETTASELEPVVTRVLQQLTGDIG